MSEKMIVACPECETRFVAPLEKFLPDGRKVRCAKCGHSWFQEIDPADVARAADVAPTADVAHGAETARSVDAAGSVDAAPAVAAETPVPAQPEEPATTASAPTESIIDRAARAQDHTHTVDETNASAELPSHRAEVFASSPTEKLAAGAAGVAAGAAGIAAATTTSASNAFESDIDDDSASIAMNEPKPISAKNERRKRSFWPRAILYSLAAAIIAGALGYFFKDEISSAVPALDPPLTSWKNTVDGVVSTAVPSNRMLKIENVKFDLTASEGEPAMLLTAEVTNESGSVQDAPKLTATIYGADNAVLKSVAVSPEEPVSEIAAQTSLDYYLRLPYPPENLERVEVDFAE